MAAKTEASAHPPEVIGNAFLEQYYPILHQYPENVHKFYQNASVISRPAADGSMSSTSTLEGINEMILSLDYKNSLVEILTADSQVSYGNGIIVLVTGYFTGKDNLKRKFSQLFFLVPQEANEYFVLNDIFRYVDEDKAATSERDITIDAAPAAPITQNEVAGQTVIDPASTTLAEDAAKSLDSNHPLDNGKISVAGEAVTTGCVDGKTQDDSDSVPENTDETGAEPASDSAVSNNQEDAPKKSYASVANALNFKKQPFQQRPSSAKPVEKPKVAVPSPVTSPRPSSAEKNSRHIAAVKGHSIFVANLPMNATTEQLRETFEKFGPIKPEGIQVRSYKQEKNCFGFVEFESAESMQSAIKVTPIMIGNRNAHIEEKKATNDGAKDLPPRRVGFRNDNFKSRGNFAGRGYGRNEGENQERYSGHPRSNGHGGGEGYYKNYQNGGGRAPRQFQEQDGKN